MEKDIGKRVFVYDRRQLGLHGLCERGVEVQLDNRISKTGSLQTLLLARDVRPTYRADECLRNMLRVTRGTYLLEGFATTST